MYSPSTYETAIAGFETSWRNVATLLGLRMAGQLSRELRNVCDGAMFWRRGEGQKSVDASASRAAVKIFEMPNAKGGCWRLFEARS